FRQPNAVDDPLTELAREGARRMLAQALIAEADAFVALWKDLKLPDGRDRVVRHGHGPHRAIQTGVGPVEVRRGKVRDRGDVGAEEKIRFSSSILPKWARRTKSLDALLPVLYLRGVSTGDFQEALAALLGKDAPNLSPAAISRLTADRDCARPRGRKIQPAMRRARRPLKLRSLMATAATSVSRRSCSSLPTSCAKTLSHPTTSMLSARPDLPQVHLERLRVEAGRLAGGRCCRRRGPGRVRVLGVEGGALVTPACQRQTTHYR